MLELLVAFLIGLQDSDNFQTRENATQALIVLGHIVDIRHDIPLKHSNPEIRKRNRDIRERLANAYLAAYAKMDSIPDMPTYQMWKYKGKLYQYPEEIYCQGECCCDPCIGKNLQTIEVPYKPKQYIELRLGLGDNADAIIDMLQAKPGGKKNGK